MNARRKIKRLSLICAVPFECDEIVHKIKPLKRDKKGHITIFRGKYADRLLTLLISGPGKANAASATTLSAILYRPELIINFGIAGAFPEAGISVGDVVLCTDDIYLEEGVQTKRGFSSLKSISLELLPDQKVYNQIPFDQKLTEKAESILSEKGFKPKKGSFITVSTITGTSERAERLRRKYRCLCETMEGASVGHIALGFGISAIQIRGVSNLVEDRDRRRWKTAEASRVCQDALLELIRQL